MQRMALVLIDGGGHQHVHLSAAQRSIEGCGVAEGDQIKAVVGWRFTPIILKWLQPLLVFVEAGQPVRTCADETVMQKLFGMLGVGRW